MARTGDALEEDHLGTRLDRIGGGSIGTDNDALRGSQVPPASLACDVAHTPGPEVRNRFVPAAERHPRHRRGEAKRIQARVPDPNAHLTVIGQRVEEKPPFEVCLDGASHSFDGDLAPRSGSAWVESNTVPRSRVPAVFAQEADAPAAITSPPTSRNATTIVSTNAPNEPSGRNRLSKTRRTGSRIIHRCTPHTPVGYRPKATIPPPTSWRLRAGRYRYSSDRSSAVAESSQSTPLMSMRFPVCCGRNVRPMAPPGPLRRVPKQWDATNESASRMRASGA